MFHVPEKFRLKNPAPGLESSEKDGNNGVFIVRQRITHGKSSRTLKCIASDGAGWEHVSVSLIDRCPRWDEMCFVKDLFWDNTDCVVQFHPEKNSYINNHPFCLHLWRCIDKEIPIPPSFLVGFKT